MQPFVRNAKQIQANPRFEMLAVLEAFSKFVVNNDGWGQLRLKCVRLSQNVSCDRCNSQRF